MIHTLSIVTVTLVNLFITAYYCWQIARQKIKPSLAMWVFFTIAVFGSLITYLSEGNYRLVDNISFLAWIGMMVAPMLSLLSSKGLLATIYSVRAIACTGLLLLLMLRVETQQRRQSA